MCRHVPHKYEVKTNIGTITVIALEFTKPKGKVNGSSKLKVLPKLESNAVLTLTVRRIYILGEFQ